jgi:LPXTG-motif cell wall-anchored protein
MTFHWSEFLVVLMGGLILLLGLAFLVLRRRNEVLQNFLTPNEPDLENEFFRVKQKPQEKISEDSPIEEESSETTEMPDENVVQWGTAPV